MEMCGEHSWLESASKTGDEGQPCGVCEAIQGAVAHIEKRGRAALATAIHELELAVQGKWDRVAYVKNVRDGLITAHDELCKQ